MTIFHIHDIITDARQGIFEHLEYDHDEDDLGGCPPGESEFARIMISVALIDADGQILKLRATFANTLLPTDCRQLGDNPSSMWGRCRNRTISRVVW